MWNLYTHQGQGLRILWAVLHDIHNIVIQLVIGNPGRDHAENSVLFLGVPDSQNWNNAFMAHFAPYAKFAYDTLLDDQLVTAITSDYYQPYKTSTSLPCLLTLFPRAPS